MSTIRQQKIRSQTTTLRLLISSKQTELSKIVKNSEESKVFQFEKKACLKKTLKVLCWVKIVELPPLLITKFYVYGHCIIAISALH